MFESRADTLASLCRNAEQFDDHKVFYVMLRDVDIPTKHFLWIPIITERGGLESRVSIPVCVPKEWATNSVNYKVAAEITVLLDKSGEGNHRLSRVRHVKLRVQDRQIINSWELWRGIHKDQKSFNTIPKLPNDINFQLLDVIDNSAHDTQMRLCTKDILMDDFNLDILKAEEIWSPSVRDGKTWFTVFETAVCKVSDLPYVSQSRYIFTPFCLISSKVMDKLGDQAKTIEFPNEHHTLPTDLFARLDSGDTRIDSDRFNNDRSSWMGTLKDMLIQDLGFKASYFYSDDTATMMTDSSEEHF